MNHHATTTVRRPIFFFFCVDDINGKPCVFYFIFLTHISQKGQHALWKYIGGGNSHAPLRYDIDRILDSGCGLGEWTMVSLFFVITLGVEERRREDKMNR